MLVTALAQPNLRKSEGSCRCTSQRLVRECKVSSLALYHLDTLSLRAQHPGPIVPSLASEPSSGCSLTPSPSPPPHSALSPVACRRAAVLRAAPSLRLPHPHRQLHGQPGPAAEDALQQVGRCSTLPGARERPTRGSLDFGRAGLGRQRMPSVHSAT